MSYTNGQSVSDVKKNISNIASKATSEFQDIKSDVKAEAKGIAAKVTSKAEDKFDDVKSKSHSASQSSSASASSIANTVLSSALSLLPVRNTDEAVSMLRTTVKDIQSGATAARDSAATFVKKYPLYSLLGAAAIGAGAVLLLSRRTKSATSEI